MKEKLAALYALQQMDSAMDALKRQYGALDVGLAEKAAFDQAKAAHQEADAALTTTTTDVRDLELEQKAVETKRQGEETKLYSGKVQNPKELQAMQDEVEMLGRQRVRLEEKMQALMSDLETRRTREAEAQAARKKAQSAFSAKTKAAKAAAETIATQARTLAGQRNGLAHTIDAALLKRYDALRAAKGGVALAALEDSNACGGCKMALPSSVVTRVRLGDDIEVCDNCRRMLCEAPVKVV